VQIIPAIDLKDNKCVRLTEGKDNTSIIFNNDPKKQAQYFQKIGCKKIHLVDLDAAFGKPDVNLPSIKEIRKSISIPIQLGGGIRSKSDAEKYFNLGIENLIVGSMSTNQPDLVKLLSDVYKERIYVSLDIKNNNLMVRGWKEESKLEIVELLELYSDVNLKGYIVTDIKNDGMLRGLNLNFISKISENIKLTNKTNKKIILAGGLTNYKDLEDLKKLKLGNIEGIISGKSFYVGNIDLVKAQNILGNNE
tara:strand:+ start:414 stop:1163 length:750 start_codon:yes stop_codon:yes gene_type:complete